MGIYRKREPCGCIWETTTFDPFMEQYPAHRCINHGGTALAQSALAAKEWAGPDDAYPDPPPQSTTGAH